MIFWVIKSHNFTQTLCYLFYVSSVWVSTFNMIQLRPLTQLQTAKISKPVAYCTDTYRLPSQTQNIKTVAVGQTCTECDTNWRLSRQLKSEKSVTHFLYSCRLSKQLKTLRYYTVQLCKLQDSSMMCTMKFKCSPKNKQQVLNCIFVTLRVEPLDVAKMVKY